MSDNAIFSVLEVKRLQKLNKRDCFCLHSWFHFSWPFLRKNWLTQLMGQTKLCHHPPPPTTSQNISTTSQNISTTTHHQPKYIHHHPPPAKVYPPLPTISQKMDHHLAKAKIYSYITSFRHCFNSSFFFEVHYSFPWQRFCVIKFWSVCFLNSKFLLHSVQFTIFKIF